MRGRSEPRYGSMPGGAALAGSKGGGKEHKLAAVMAQLVNIPEAEREAVRSELRKDGSAKALALLANLEDAWGRR